VYFSVILALHLAHCQPVLDSALIYKISIHWLRPLGLKITTSNELKIYYNVNMRSFIARKI